MDSGYDHSDSDGMVLRTQLTPLMDKYDIDIVLQDMMTIHTPEHISYRVMDRHMSNVFTKQKIQQITQKKTTATKSLIQQIKVERL